MSEYNRFGTERDTTASVSVCVMNYLFGILKITLKPDISGTFSADHHAWLSGKNAIEGG